MTNVVLLKKRVDRLDDLMANLVRVVTQVDHQLRDLANDTRQFKIEMHVSHERSEREMHEFKAEMQAFRNGLNASHDRSEQEMREFKAEMHAFKDALNASHDRSEQEMRDFKAEMHVSHERSEREMREFKAEMKASRAVSEQEMQAFKHGLNASHERSEREMQAFQQASQASDASFRQEKERFMRKMGTLAEDMVAPSIPHVLCQVFDCAPEAINFIGVRVRRVHQITKRNQEFDVVAICGDYLCLNETKSKLTSEAVNDFINKVIPNAREFFPEYPEKKIIGLMASFYVDDSVVRQCERQGLIVLGIGHDMMEVLNAPGFRPTSF